MLNRINSAIEKIFIVLFAICMESCDKQNEPLSDMTRTMIEEGESIPGISFNLESDSLVEEVEEIYFEAKEWDEEEMDADL